MHDNLARCIEKIRASGQDAAVADAFQFYYQRLCDGDTGLIREADIEPVKPETLPDMRVMEPYEQAGQDALSRTAILKLNGGLGTSMGLRGPKCMLEAKSGYTFLEIACNQVLKMRESGEAPLPFLLMNSFYTHEPTARSIEQHPACARTDAIMFQQNKFPKLLEDSLLPATCPEEPVLEWAPPGHGDIYLALRTSGALDSLLDRGVRYLFVANIDNLGATLDTRLLGYFARHDLPFMMEAVERTPMDRKGGHIANRKDGGMILREIAQAAKEDMDLFQDVQRHHYFNSNNLWINLDRLRAKLDEAGGFLPLPLIRNRKRLRPKDDRTPAVVQLETAMGAAIAQFPGARAALVDHDRYRPVKKTDDLLLLWSDCYRLDTRFLLTEEACCAGHGPVIELDDRFYGSLDQLKARFARGAPSLVSCTKLRIRGDVFFEEGVRIEGDVTLVNTTPGPVTVEKDACIDQDRTW